MSPTATYITKLLRDFADEPSATLADEIAGLLDKPVGMGEVLAKCFRAMAQNMHDEPDKAALELAEAEGRDGGLDEMREAICAELNDLNMFDHTWINNTLKDAVRRVS